MWTFKIINSIFFLIIDLLRLFLLESVLVVSVFLGIFPFHLGYLIGWYIGIHSILLFTHLNFCEVDIDALFLILII